MGEKFANMSRMYTSLLELTNTRQSNFQHMVQGHEETFLLRRNTNGQKHTKKMLNVITYERNAHPNHREVPLHSYWGG